MINQPEISFLIEASNPGNLAKFYAAAMKSKILKGMNNEHWLVLCPNGVKIQIFRSSKFRSSFPKGRSMAPCLQLKPSKQALKDLTKWSSEIQLFGAKVLETPRKEFFGAESWLLDPEGNAFLLLVPNM